MSRSRKLAHFSNVQPFRIKTAHLSFCNMMGGMLHQLSTANYQCSSRLPFLTVIVTGTRDAMGFSTTPKERATEPYGAKALTAAQSAGIDAGNASVIPSVLVGC